MKRLSILLLTPLLGACSDKTKTIGAEMSFEESAQSATDKTYAHLDAIVKLKKIDNEIFWSLDILDPETGPPMPDRALSIRKVAFQWLKNPHPVSNSPYVSIEFKDTDGFTLESANNRGKSPSLVEERYEGEGYRNGLTVNRLRTQGSLSDPKSRFGSISACEVKVICDQKSRELLSDILRPPLRQSDGH